MSNYAVIARWIRRIFAAGTALGLMLSLGSIVNAASPPPMVSISNVPMTLVIPAHPQVMIAVTNSQSMDGDLSGAIMTGSGAGSAVTQLLNSSSPLCYAVPSGFTPPLLASSSSCPSGSAPYTVDGSNNVGSSVSGTLYDNSASRLNVAKASITSVLQTYSSTDDFGLMDYSTGSPTLYTTYVYYMSPQTGPFTFSATNTSPPPGTTYIANPCFSNGTGTSTVASDCQALQTFYGTSAVVSDQYLGIGFSSGSPNISYTSDDPSINDVLYAGGQDPVCVVYSNPSPNPPYPPNVSLAQYNSGSVTVTYQSQVNSCAKTTGPTNAGFVPYQPQTMYALRGFGYYTSQSATTGNVLVNVNSAGQNPTPSQVATYVAQFAPFLKPETNSILTSEIKALAVQSPIAGILQGALNYYQTSNPPSSNGCKPLRFVILMTDGLPTFDLSGKNWPPLGSASASNYGVTATFDPTTGALTSTNDQALTDTIAQLAALKSQGIQTFIIGMGAGVNPALNPQAAATLKAMAIAGGTGNYFPATSAAAVTKDLQTILAAIQGENQANSAAAVNSTGLNAGSTAYQASYTSDDTPDGDWTGNLTAYPINPSTGIVNLTAPDWNAQALLDNLTASTGWQANNRKIATWNSTGGTSGTGAGVPFEWTSISTAQQTELQPSDTLGQARLNYLRGDQSNEAPSGDGFRPRSHRLGDIVDSNPLYIAVPNGPYGVNDSTYVSFEQANMNRQPMLYVGANDGMLHAFDANTGKGPSPDPNAGKELFAFIPNGVFANLIKLTQPTYNAAHQFYVDGSPAGGDVKFGGSACTGPNVGNASCWHTILVGGLNDGGNSIYALDVTNPAGITSESAAASAVLWEFTDSTLGLTYSRPFITQTNDTADTNANPNGFIVFFGSGYNNSDGNDYLYALNPQTGALIAKINLCAKVSGACNSTLPNGLSSVVAVNGGGGLGVPATTVYAGDLQGNLWKVDISNASSANWVVSLLFQARDPSGNPQPITTTPLVTLNPNFPRLSGPLVFFGTGQFLGPPDITNTQVQSFYAIWDNGGSAPTRSQLQQQMITDVAAGAPTAGGGTTSFETRTVTNNSINWSTQRGWYMDLGKAVSSADTGERVITDPRLENGRVVFTTYVPSSNACTAGGGAFLMVVNYKNGGSFAQPEMDINGDGNINSNDQLQGGANPVGLALGNVYATSPTIMSANLGNVKAVKLITEAGSNGTVIKSVHEHGGGQRTAWRQIQ